MTYETRACAIILLACGALASALLAEREQVPLKNGIIGGNGSGEH